MTIRGKIFLGFVMIATALLLSSLVAIYEFTSMRKEISTVISENITSVNISNRLLEITDEYNFTLFKSMEQQSEAVIPDIEKDTRFADLFEELTAFYNSVTEQSMADSVRYAYTAYIHILKLAPEVWQGGAELQSEWYFNRMYPVYMQLRGYIEQLTVLSQKALEKNFNYLNESFYRSLMPSVAAVTVGILLIFLFNYFINHYFVTPILNISKGLANYKNYGKRYYVTVEDGELNTLNNNIAELTELNSKLKAAKQAEAKAQK